ncbi:MAG: aminopeptidase [Oscillospiraceae bacterium]|nr:aminopeptidase [Oscillospiraceae bacterium]
MSELLYTPKNAYEVLSAEEIKEAYDYCEGYKKFLDNGKTERTCVSYSIEIAKAHGFVEFVDGKKYNAGDKVYVNQKNKSAIFAVIGSESPEKGFNITAGHIDAPRLDIRPNPLYEDGNMAYLKTHYYGGIRKYQWTTIPLSLIGVICKKDGTTVNVNIGEDENDPVFYITDLLPHLAKDNKPIQGEDLNIVIGSSFDKEEKENKIKKAVLKILNEKYGVTECDFQTAELTIVPAAKAKDVGLDRSLIGSYGHDDRVCSYPAFTSLLSLDKPEKTSVAFLVDKEEIGSAGITGMRSAFVTDFLLALCDGYNARIAFKNSAALSTDVGAAFDPTFPEAYEKRNSAFINCGPAICKYTGSRGKSGASDACPEFIAKLAGIFDANNVLYQFCELGRIDQGGGGTVAQFIADRNIEVLDVGVAMLSMHAPYELASKTDIYMLHKLCKAFYENY